MENALIKWDSLKQAIEEAKSVSDLSKIRDKAEAIRYTLKIAGESRDVVRQAEEIKLRAERRAGEILLRAEKQKPGQYQVSEPRTLAPTYSDLGIDRRDASIWQRIASIPKSEFELWLASAPEITTTGALSISKRIQKEAFFQPEEGDSIITVLERAIEEVEEGLESIKAEIKEFGISDEHQRKELFFKLDETSKNITLLKKEIKKARKAGVEDSELQPLGTSIEKLNADSVKIENLITDTAISNKTRLSFLPIGQRAIIEKVFNIIKANVKDDISKELINKIIQGLKQ